MLIELVLPLHCLYFLIKQLVNMPIISLKNCDMYAYVDHCICFSLRICIVFILFLIYGEYAKRLV